MALQRFPTAESLWPRCQCGCYWQPSDNVDSLITAESDYHGFDGTSCIPSRAWVDQTIYSPR
jgi:hypothetical protein